MSEYRHILAAVDCSPAGTAAVRRAEWLATASGARLSLLHVIGHFPEDFPNDWIPPEDADPSTWLQARAREVLDFLCAETSAVEAERHVRLSRGSAAREITEFAADNAVDLIVVGSHGKRGLAALLGSVSEHVLRQATCDVLVVRGESG